jgi:hypothetical protein
MSLWGSSKVSGVTDALTIRSILNVRRAPTVSS